MEDRKARPNHPLESGRRREEALHTRECPAPGPAGGVNRKETRLRPCRNGRDAGSSRLCVASASVQWQSNAGRGGHLENNIFVYRVTQQRLPGLDSRKTETYVHQNASGQPMCTMFTAAENLGEAVPPAVPQSAPCLSRVWAAQAQGRPLFQPRTSLQPPPQNPPTVLGLRDLPRPFLDRDGSLPSNRELPDSSEPLHPGAGPADHLASLHPRPPTPTSLWASPPVTGTLGLCRARDTSSERWLRRRSRASSVSSSSKTSARGWVLSQGVWEPPPEEGVTLGTPETPPGPGEEPDPGPVGPATPGSARTAPQLCGFLERCFLGVQVELTRKTGDARLRSQVSSVPGWAGQVCLRKAPP